MKVYQTNEIKNIALLGSSGSGKTTLVEAMLFESGVIKRRGSIAAKNTVSDYFPVEQEYGYSVFSTVLHVEWNNKKLNIIDCPGSDDFVGSTVTALNVTDTAIILLNGQYGVEVGTQNHFRYTEKLNKPVIFLVNQLDNEKCDYDNILEQLKEAYGSKVVPIQYPISTGPGFNALIDVLLMKKYSWKPEGGAPVIEDIPAEELEKATEMHWWRLLPKMMKGLWKSSSNKTLFRKTKCVKAFVKDWLQEVCSRYSVSVEVRTWVFVV